MEEKIYPLYYKGKFWTEEEVDHIFKSFYFTKLALDYQTSVYLGDGLRRTPDGEWVE